MWRYGPGEKNKRRADPYREGEACAGRQMTPTKEKGSAGHCAQTPTFRFFLELIPSFSAASSINQKNYGARAVDG